jgi:hypothetical protein
MGHHSPYSFTSSDVPASNYSLAAMARHDRGATRASGDIDKPSVVDGEISIDISALVDAVPSGPYYSVVGATRPGVTSASSPSPAFAK